MLGDDRNEDQPICLAITDSGFNLYRLCLPESHKILYEWIDFLATGAKVQSHQCLSFPGKYYETDTYRFVNDVPLRDGKKALNVNWCEITTTTSDGTIIYRKPKATNHLITEANVIEIVADV